jgi:hypothetical protein
MSKFSLFVGAAALTLPGFAAAQQDLGPLNLPTTATGLPLLEDFETAAGVIPPYMALTNLEVATLTTFPEAWCNIGQLAPCLGPYGGSYCLEMGLDPNSTNYTQVRNTMVLLLDPAGYTGDMNLSYAGSQWGEETNPVDGVWISSNGTSWYMLDGPWNKFSSSGTWRQSGQLDLTGTPVNTSVPFYVAFCQEDNFPYQDLDGVGIDDIKVPGDPFFMDLGPINLPNGTIGMPWTEGFELFQGSVPPYISVNSIDVATNGPDPEGFCNVGQLATCIQPFSGSQCLEMGLAVGASSHYSRQVMVLGVDGTGYTGEKSISWLGLNQGEEAHDVDGVWISDDGVRWVEINQGWSGSTLEYEHSGSFGFGSLSVNTDGVFYIAFAQEDNGIYDLGSDGYAIDDINIPAQPAPPMFEVSPMIGGRFSTFTVESGYINRVCKFLASTRGGGPSVVQGVELFLTPPILQLADVLTDTQGTAIHAMIIPAGASGMQVWMQSAILAQGGVVTSNSVVTTIQ